MEIMKTYIKIPQHVKHKMKAGDYFPLNAFCAFTILIMLNLKVNCGVLYTFILKALKKSCPSISFDFSNGLNPTQEQKLWYMVHVLRIQN